jgi:hypothetical protein
MHPCSCLPVCYNYRSMVTKRLLGIFVLVVGIALGAGTVAVDLVQIGEWSGFGPLQRLGLAAGAVLIAVGIGLIRLGDRPA